MSRLTAPEASGGLLVRLAARPQLSDLSRMPRGAERKQAAYARLVATAAESQKRFVALATQLQGDGKITGFESLTSPNMLVVRPSASSRAEVLKAFSVDGVKAIYDAVDGRRVFPAPVVDARRGSEALSSRTPSWGLDVLPGRRYVDAPTAQDQPWGIPAIGAPEAWAAGATGKGTVFGSIDTGADWKHEALRGAYRGVREDGTVDHDYNWFDMNPAALRKDEPSDENGHGTHTIGTTVGKAGERSIGVAPEAKWISVRGLTGSGGVEAILKSLQFMQAPTKRDGSLPDASKAPDVVGMSFWAAPPHEDVFQDSVQNLNFAGIAVVKSAGNQGPGPESATSPGQYAEVTATAATDRSGQVAEFSSRGPSPLPHHGRRPAWKPDFAAPGVDVVSAMPGNRYGTMSGTSMAQPHMSGAILAVSSRFPDLRHDQVLKLLEKGAADVGARGRDLEFGHGLINVAAAVRAGLAGARK